MEKQFIAKCSCGKTFAEIPSNAKLLYEPGDALSGYYWNCECKSTLFVPISKAAARKMIAKTARNGRGGPS